jgi:hypothetical protein
MVGEGEGSKMSGRVEYVILWKTPFFRGLPLGEKKKKKKVVVRKDNPIVQHDS